MSDNQPTTKRHITVISGACLAIILGAIGSGVWELVLHPTARRGWLIVTDFTARYSTQYQNKVVLIAANDPYTSFFSAFLGLLFSAVIIFIFETWRKIISAGLDLRKIQNFGAVDEITNIDKNNLNKTIRSYFKNISLKRLFVVLVSLGTVLSGIGFWVVLQVTAVGVAVSITRDFKVSMQACEPYIGVDKTARLRSRFATMRTWVDYQSLAQDVNKISDEFQVPLPHHTPIKR